MLLLLLLCLLACSVSASLASFYVLQKDCIQRCTNKCETNFKTRVHVFEKPAEHNNIRRREKLWPAFVKGARSLGVFCMVGPPYSFKWSLFRLRNAMQCKTRNASTSSRVTLSISSSRPKTQKGRLYCTLYCTQRRWSLDIASRNALCLYEAVAVLLAHRFGCVRQMRLTVHSPHIQMNTI